MTTNSADTTKRMLTNGPLAPIINKVPGELILYREEDDDQIVFQIRGHPKHSLVDGRIYPPRWPLPEGWHPGVTHLYRGEDIRSVSQVEFHADDVVVQSFPRCGTVWTLNIVAHLALEKRDMSYTILKQAPDLEMWGNERIVKYFKPPRVMKTHIPPSRLSSTNIAKFILCIRNPKDCFVSFFNYIRIIKGFNCADLKFEALFEQMINGESDFGDYFDQINEFLRIVDQPNVLLVRFEETKKDVRAQIKRIGDFIGGRAAERAHDPETLEKIVHLTSAEVMSQHETTVKPMETTGAWVRKGHIRGWRNYFTKEMSDRLDAKFRERLGGTIAENWWTEEMAWDEEESPAEH